MNITKNTTVSHHVVGIDIGGSHITTAIVNIEREEIEKESRTKRSVDTKGASEEILEKWCTAITKAIAVLPPDGELLGYGVAMPGPLDYDKGICLIKGLGKFEALYGVNLRHALKSRLEIPERQPIIFRNDSVCFLLGEQWKGAAKGYVNLIGITLGTGFGSAFMRNGEIRGQGEEGLPPSGWFYNVPFKDGIADDYFSSRGLLRLYKEESGERLSDAVDIAKRASEEEAAKNTFLRFGCLLSEFLEPWIHSIKPDCVVVGGNITRSWKWFGSALVDMLNSKVPGVAIRPSLLFEDAALFGAALLPLRYKEPK